MENFINDYKYIYNYTHIDKYCDKLILENLQYQTKFSIELNYIISKENENENLNLKYNLFPNEILENNYNEIKKENTRIKKSKIKIKLETYYKKFPHKWNKELIIKISNKSKLPFNTVYKWNWNKNKK